MKTRFPLAAIALGSAATILAPASLAQDAPPRQAPPRQAAPGGSDRVIIGMGAAVIPTYQGADDYRVLQLPALDIEVGRYFANMRNGIGAKVIDTETVSFGASVALTPGYRRRDVPDGVDNINYGAGMRLFGTVRMGGIIANLGGTRSIVGGTRGTTVDASLAYPIAASPRLVLIPAIGTTWGNAKNNNRYFGIDETEAQDSGLPQFAPGSGFIDATASITASYRLTDRLSASATGGITRLLGDNGNSPLVKHKTQPIGVFSLTYRL